MTNRRRPSKWLKLTAAIGLLFGMLSEGDASNQEWNSLFSSLGWSVFAFLFFFLAHSFFAFGERCFLGLQTRFRWVVNRNLPPVKADSRRYGFERHSGVFFLFFGAGILTSSVWSDTAYFWDGFPFASGGLGILLGIKLSRRILKLSDNENP